MSTIKSSNEDITINADGSGRSVKFQANGVEKASIDSSGNFTSTSIDATKLSGIVPNFTSTGIDDNATSTAVTLDSSGNVGIGTTTPSEKLEVVGTVKATTVDLGNWTVTESAGVLYFATSGTNKMKLDASGNLTVTGNVTAYGTV